MMLLNGSADEKRSSGKPRKGRKAFSADPLFMTRVRRRWLNILKHTMTLLHRASQNSSAYSRGVPDCLTIRPASASIHPAQCLLTSHVIEKSSMGIWTASGVLTRPNTLTCPLPLPITKPNGLPISLTSYPDSLHNRLM